MYAPSLKPLLLSSTRMSTNRSFMLTDMADALLNSGVSATDLTASAGGVPPEHATHHFDYQHGPPQHFDTVDSAPPGHFVDAEHSVDGNQPMYPSYWWRLVDRLYSAGGASNNDVRPTDGAMTAASVSSTGGSSIYPPLQYVGHAQNMVDYLQPQQQGYSSYETHYGASLTAGTYYPAQVAAGYHQPSYIGANEETAGTRGRTVDDESTQQLSHTTRASPATIQWLLENYETADGVSLPRCTLYTHYQAHCKANNLDPVNAASFGKLIRSVFLGLRTRRLGTRGNSKYHYYGIRIKPESALNNYPLSAGASADDSLVSMRHHSMQHKRYHHGSSADMTSGRHETSGLSEYGAPHDSSSAHLDHREQSLSETIVTDAHEFSRYLGDGRLPSVPTPSPEGIEPLLVELRIQPPDAAAVTKRFADAYVNHARDILTAVMRMRLHEVELFWRQFWQPQANVVNVDRHQMEGDIEATNPIGLTRLQMYAFCSCENILQYIEEFDFRFYECLVNVLIPDVLRSVPSSLTQQIRNFAKGIEQVMKNALEGAPEELISRKVRCVNAFCSTLRRYTSLSHLSNAARQVLQNDDQVALMLNDLNRVNMRDIKDQAAFVCNCDVNVIEWIERDFKSVLAQQRELEGWATWLRCVADRVLADANKDDPAKMLLNARQFLLKWSFYSSMIIRDLTLRSATSFGSFHLIRLLFDEYMFYLIEHKVAHITGQTTMAVLAKYESLPRPEFSDRSFYHAYAPQNGSDHYQSYLTPNGYDHSLAKPMMRTQDLPGVEVGEDEEEEDEDDGDIEPDEVPPKRLKVEVQDAQADELVQRDSQQDAMVNDTPGDSTSLAVE